MSYVSGTKDASQACDILEKLVRSSEMADKARQVVEEMKGIVHANTSVAMELLWHGTDTQHPTNCGTDVDAVDTYFSYQCATLPDCPTKVDTFAPKIVRALLRDLGYGIY